jgi:hypothetical protein
MPLAARIEVWDGDLCNHPEPRVQSLRERMGKTWRRNEASVTSIMNCPFCSIELIDAIRDNLWKDMSVHGSNSYYCVKCELAFDDACRQSRLRHLSLTWPGASYLLTG